jgi:microcystin-dependent protein
VFNQGSGDPSGGISGGLYLKTGAPSGTSSNLWVKNTDGTWVEVAADVGLHVPVGAVLGWPSKAAVPTNFLEANGQAQSTSTYADLFAVYAYDHGGSGGTFNVPNFNNKLLRGTTTVGNIGTTTGSDTVTLAVANIPIHSHGMNHTHTLAHTHGIDHDHAAGTTGYQSADHYHNTYGYTSVENQSHSHNQNVTSGTGGSASRNDFTADGNGLSYPQGTTTDAQNQNHVHTVNLNSGGVSANHTHTFDVSAMFGSTTSQSNSTTSGASVITTDNAGSGTSFSIVPASAHIRWIIRAV